VQAEDEEDAETLRYLPATQLVQLVASTLARYLPAPQVVHALEAAAAKAPETQLRQAAEEVAAEEAE